MDIKLKCADLTSIDGYVVCNGKRAIVCLRTDLPEEDALRGLVYLEGLCKGVATPFVQLWKVGDETETIT